MHGVCMNACIHAMYKVHFLRSKPTTSHTQILIIYKRKNNGEIEKFIFQTVLCVCVYNNLHEYSYSIYVCTNLIY